MSTVVNRIVNNLPDFELLYLYNAQFSNDSKMKRLNKFCSEACIKKNRSADGILQCNCGEDIGICVWHWSKVHSSPGIRITNDSKDILFHPCYSAGTALVRGDVCFQPNFHYYWEIKITSNMYGTDVMVGVGTSKVESADCNLTFCSLLGMNEESWGYSYHGKIQHNSLVRKYGSKFALGSIVGVHLDMYKGTLEYYLNRKPLGIAFFDLKGYQLYPMVSSTAAQSAIRLVCAVSEEQTLQMFCLKSISKQKNVYKDFQNIPGLRNLYDRKYFWIVPTCDSDPTKRLAEMEDKLMMINYKQFMGMNKKQRTSCDFNEDLYDLVDDPNLTRESNGQTEDSIKNQHIKSSPILDPSTSTCNCNESQI